MGKSLGGVFLTIFVSSSLIYAASGQDTKQGHFQVLQKHPDIKVCANEVLKENAFVGGRVSELTGKCYGLPHSWGLNQTIQNGYAYVKKTFVQESFKPPLKLEYEATVWMIPGVFNPGTKLDLFLSMQVLQDGRGSLRVLLRDTPGVCYVRDNQLSLDFDSSGLNIGEYFNTSHRVFDRVKWSAPETSKEMLQISLLAHSGSATIQINQKGVTTIEASGLIGKRQVCVQTKKPTSNRILVHRIEFTAK